MKNLRNYVKKMAFGMVTLTAVFIWSCSDEETTVVTSSDTQNVQGESVTDSYFDESNDFSTIAVAGTSETFTGRTENGRTNGEVKGLGDIDNRLSCAVVTVVKDVNSSVSTPRGVITIDFKDGCTDPKGNIRKGKIIVTYDGRRFMLNSKIITTFNGYSVNGIKIEGTNTLTNLTANLESAPKFKTEVVGGKVTFVDGKTATRDHVLTREWTRAQNPTQDSWKVEGSATGSNREGVSYQMEITKALVYKRSCVASKVFVAVEGTKKFTSGDRTMTIDFGSGDCDNKVTVTVNGVSKEVEIKADGSN
ncbi:MAG: hypothetical protein JJE09_04245 [Bacteroidia bacterium]|nr:hypothetical protein [Bacteroidia bacterium]